MFADDTALWKCSKNGDHIKRFIQRALKYTPKWCDEWRFKVSVAKTSFVLFHRMKNKKVDLFFFE